MLKVLQNIAEFIYNILEFVKDSFDSGIRIIENLSALGAKLDVYLAWLPPAAFIAISGLIFMAIAARIWGRG